MVLFLVAYWNRPPSWRLFRSRDKIVPERPIEHKGDNAHSELGGYGLIYLS